MWHRNGREGVDTTGALNADYGLHMLLVEDDQWFRSGAVGLAGAFVVLSLLLAASARKDLGRYSRGSAVRRAAAYFAVCWTIALLTGVTTTLGTTAVATGEQLGSATWWVWLVVSVAVVAIAYGLIWPKGTLTHGRAFTPLWFLLFGLAWGLSQGQLYLSFWSVTERALGTGVLTAIVVWLVISAFTGVWHDKYWDRLVSPDHNIEEWNGRKVAFCHVPNLIVTLAFLYTHGNALIFVLLQTLALTLSAWFMRFPRPVRG